MSSSSQFRANQLLLSADSLPNNKFITTSFSTVHQNKIATFPFNQSLAPAQCLQTIDKNASLHDEDEPAAVTPDTAQHTFVPDTRFAQFVASIPDQTVGLWEVKRWLYMWFCLEGIPGNDARVRGFLAGLTMNGRDIHSIVSYGSTEYLLCHDNFCLTTSSPWLADDIIISLANYVWYAKTQDDVN